MSKFKKNVDKELKFETMNLALFEAIKKTISKMAEEWVSKMPVTQIKQIYEQIGEGDIDFNKPEIQNLVTSFKNQMKPPYFGYKYAPVYIPFAIRAVIKKKYAQKIGLFASTINLNLIKKYDN